jgi:hypothetical protein
MEFFRAGGFPMWFIMVFGLVGIVNAARFAWAPGPNRVGYLVALGLAVLFAGIAGTATDFMAVGFKVPENFEASNPDLPLIVLRGFGESMAPIVFATGLLMAKSLLVALGLRRLAA